MDREQQAAQEMAEGYAAQVNTLEDDLRAKIQWARDVETALTAEVNKQTTALVKAVDALHCTEKELEERTAWALTLDKQTKEQGEQLALVRGSRWVKLGRKVGLGPELPLS